MRCLGSSGLSDLSRSEEVSQTLSGFEKEASGPLYTIWSDTSAICNQRHSIFNSATSTVKPKSYPGLDKSGKDHECIHFSNPTSSSGFSEIILSSSPVSAVTDASLVDSAT